MIGLSVSLCVREISEGKMALLHVEKVVGSTRAEGVKDWLYVIRSYRRNYWYNRPWRATLILLVLLAMGKVEQPRIEGKPYPDVSKSIWVANENDILYCS